MAKNAFSALSYSAKAERVVSTAWSSRVRPDAVINRLRHSFHASAASEPGMGPLPSFFPEHSSLCAAAMAVSLGFRLLLVRLLVSAGPDTDLDPAAGPPVSADFEGFFDAVGHSSLWVLFQCVVWQSLEQ